MCKCLAAISSILNRVLVSYEEQERGKFRVVRFRHPGVTVSDILSLGIDRAYRMNDMMRLCLVNSYGRYSNILGTSLSMLRRRHANAFLGRKPGGGLYQ